MSRGSKTGRAFWLGRAYSLSMSIRATLADSRCPSAHVRGMGRTALSSMRVDPLLHDVAIWQ